MVLYDEFTGTSPAADKWQIAGVPLGDGNFWLYQDNNATVNCNHGCCLIEIPTFSSSHDQVQMFDNPKQLYLAPKAWDTTAGPVTFSCTMGGHVTGNPTDYRDGFASFNVLDFGSAMVFDLICNGSKVWAVYERLQIPGLTTSDEAFTEVIELPVATAPMREHVFQITYDRTSNTVRYEVDGNLLLVREDIPVPVDTLTTGFGLITLQPITDAKSVSCHGQGGKCQVAKFYVPA